jgi:hypothetical protein
LIYELAAEQEDEKSMREREGMNAPPLTIVRQAQRECEVALMTLKKPFDSISVYFSTKKGTRGHAVCAMKNGKLMGRVYRDLQLGEKP